MTSMGNTWRSAAYCALSELERKSEAVYNKYPKAHLITEVDALSDMMKEAWPNDYTILFELQMLSLYAIRELIRIGEWDKHELAYLLTTKQHDYGTGNILAFGMIGIAVRMTDKLARLKNLADRTAENESTIDTLHDIVGYAVVATMLDNETFFIKELGLGIDDELV